MAPLRQAPNRRIPVRSDEDVGVVRRALGGLAERCPGIGAGEAALVATELATNIVRHTRAGGYVLYREAGGGIEILAVDHGPGMRNVGLPGRALLELPPRPAASGGTGLGVGLAGVARLATVFDLYSTESAGTVVLARLLPSAPPPGWCRYGGVDIPIDESGISGDMWELCVNGSSAVVAVVDGLGHGPGAADAAAAAMSVLAEPGGGPTDPARFLARAHEAMRQTRGGMLAVCAVDADRGELRSTGVGNIGTWLVSAGRTKALAWREGLLGTAARPPRANVLVDPWAPGDRLLLASDGLRAHWELDAYPGLLGHDPAMVAATLARDHGRATDDVTVVVVEDLRGQVG